MFPALIALFSLPLNIEWDFSEFNFILLSYHFIILSLEVWKSALKFEFEITSKVFLVKKKNFRPFRYSLELI